jgi:hypothetical protein
VLRKSRRLSSVANLVVEYVITKYNRSYIVKFFYNSFSYLNFSSF